MLKSKIHILMNIISRLWQNCCNIGRNQVKLTDIEICGRLPSFIHLLLMKLLRFSCIYWLRDLFWVSLLTDESQEFFPCLWIFSEHTQHGTGDGLAVQFLNTSHDHAHVSCFNNNSDSCRSNGFSNGHSNLFS